MEQRKEEQLTLLEQLRQILMGAVNRSSQVFTNLAKAFEEILNPNRQPVVRIYTYQQQPSGGHSAGDPPLHRQGLPQAPSVISHEGVQRWFTPMESGGNKNIAAGRLGALLGLQSVTGSDEKAFLAGKGEGSLQSVSAGAYIHDLADVKMGVSYQDETFHKDLSGLTLIRYLTGNPSKSADSLVLNSEMAGASLNGRQEVKLTGIRDTDHTFGFGSGSGMDVSEIRVLSREAADKLGRLNEDTLRHALKDLLSEEQIKGLGRRLEQVKGRLEHIKVAGDGGWDEEARRLNKESPVYHQMVRLLGPEAAVAREEQILKPIPPAPPLPEIKEVSVQELQTKERKTPSQAAVKPASPPPSQNARESMMEELKAVLKSRNEKLEQAAPRQMKEEPQLRKKGMGM